MGLYRFLLALLVIISHCGISLHGIDVGVVAVISFYIISGYVMTLLINKAYASFSTVHIFYLDRAIRLFPQYLFYLICAFVLLRCKVLGNEIAFLVPGDLCPSWRDLISEAVLIPNGLYMFVNHKSYMIPQSWSLALEISFYFLIPFYLLVLSAKWKKSLAIISFFVFLLAYLGVVNTDFWGYRLLPGVFFVFLIGVYFAKQTYKNVYIVLGLSVVLLWIAFLFPDIGIRKHNKEVLIGIIAGIIFMFFITHLKVQESRFSKI